MNYNVFISSKSEDYPYARQIYNLLVANGLNVFLADTELSKKGIAEYGEVIDEALDSAEHLVVVASNAEYVRSPYVKNEWRIFLEEKRSGRKNGNIITVLKDESMVGSLPVSLRLFQSFTFDNFEKIVGFLTKSNEDTLPAPPQTATKSDTSDINYQKAWAEWYKTREQRSAQRAQGIFEVGDIYDDGTKRGVVFEISDDGRHGKIISFEHSKQKWAYGNWLGAFGSSSMPCNQTVNTYNDDGLINMQRIMTLDNWETNYPAFAWCHSLGKEWYLPTIKEYQTIMSHQIVEVINQTLVQNGAKECIKSDTWYWTSVEDKNHSAFYIEFLGLARVEISSLNKSNSATVRAVAKF